jgi:hypothetical protein
MPAGSEVNPPLNKAISKLSQLNLKTTKESLPNLTCDDLRTNNDRPGNVHFQQNL